MNKEQEPVLAENMRVIEQSLKALQLAKEKGELSVNDQNLLALSEAMLGTFASVSTNVNRLVEVVETQQKTIDTMTQHNAEVVALLKGWVGGETPTDGQAEG